MCKKCKEVLHRAFPTNSEAELHHILWCETCFPFGSPLKVIYEILKSKAARTAGKRLDMRTQQWVS